MDKKITELETLIKALIIEHESMALLLEKKREALRSGDGKQLTLFAQSESKQLNRIAELEKNRLSLVANITLLINPNAPQPMKLMQLAEALGEPQRGRLLMLRHQLLKRMEQVKNQASVARQASESILKHMNGLVATVSAFCTGVPTYNATGNRPKEALKVSTFSAIA